MASIANMLKTVMQETNTSVPIQASTQVATPPSPKKPSPEPSPTDTKIKNKGTGAGGANTNKNGLSYESLTDLDDKLEIVESGQYSCKIKFNVSDVVLTRTKQSHLFKCMKDHINKQVKKAHGCKNPDECYINEATKTMFIIEKKFQQTPGSVCEKIQTPDFKIWQYSRTFPEYDIVYVYCLSDWFKDNCQAELEYLEFKKIPIFWGASETYKTDIINFMVNYVKT